MGKISKSYLKEVAERKKYQSGGFTGPRDNFSVKQSNIPGANNGLFSNTPMRKGQLIGLAHENNQPVGTLGNMHNHSESPNMRSVKIGNQRYLYADRDITPGEELTTNYRFQPELEQPEDFSRNMGNKRFQDGGAKSPVILPQIDYDLEKAPKQGNFLLSDIDRPFYIDDEGWKRSEYRMGVNVDGKETLIPTVVNGTQLTEDQAIQRYYDTGLHMGQYNTVPESEYASRMRTLKYNMLEDPVRFGTNYQTGGTKKPIPRYVEDRIRSRSTSDATAITPVQSFPKPLPVPTTKTPTNLGNNYYQQANTRDETLIAPVSPFPKLTPAQMFQQFEDAVQAEAEERQVQSLQAEREAAAKTKQAVEDWGDENATFTFPAGYLQSSGTTKAWKDMDWREKAYVSGRNLGSWNAGNWTDYVNPVAMLGSWAEGLGSAPYVARETDSLMPYVTGIGSPLLVGALGGLGTKSTGQFVNNLANPLAGINLNLTNKVGNALYNLQESLPTGRIKDNILGASKGIHDIASGRPFFETFPITKKQRRAVETAQDKAFEEGLEFVKEWNYPRNILTLRPEVSTRIQNIFPEAQGLGTNMQPFFKRNPIYTANNVLVNSKTSFLAKNPNISNEAKQYILSRRGKIGGVNMGGTNESITLRNHGFYYNPPSRIKDVAAHELGHSMQKLGTDFGIDWGQQNWGQQIATSHPDYKYLVANRNTPFGRYMGDAMVKPVKGQFTWEASPLEPHSELMVARMNVFEDLMRNSNFTPNQVMQLLQNPDDALTDILIKRNNLDRFFEPTTSQQVKRNIVRALPVVGAGVLQQNLGQPSETTYQMGGTIGVPRVNGQVVSSGSYPITSVKKTRGSLKKDNKGNVKTMSNQQVKQVLKYSKQKPNKI